MALIARLRAILADEREISKIIVGEMRELKETYGDARRTEIVDEIGDISIEDMIADEDMAVTISHEGYIKRNPVSLYRAQRRGGKGKIGTTTREEDFVEHLFIASTHSFILFFTTIGKVYWIKVHEVPQAGRAARGKAIVNLLELRGRGEDLRLPPGPRVPREPLRALRDQAGRREEDRPHGLRRTLARRGSSRSVSIAGTRSWASG